MDKVRLVHCNTLNSFSEQYSSNNIKDSDICFISEIDAIWTHGNFYGGRNIISRTIKSDSKGMILIEDIEGYSYLNGVAINQNQPLNVIRFGDNLYIGYYGGASIPSTSSAVDLLFTPIPNIDVIIYYIKN